jgi:hypothetical protein
MTDRTEGRTPLSDDELERIRDLADDDIATVRDMRLVLAELERLNSWHGLMSVLDEKYPEDIFPTREDDDARDPGPRIVSLLRWVDRLRAENTALAAKLADTEAALERRHLQITSARRHGDSLLLPVNADDDPENTAAWGRYDMWGAFTASFTPVTTVAADIEDTRLWREAIALRTAIWGDQDGGDRDA